MSTSVTATKVSKLLALAIAVVIVLVPFQAFLTTWLGANFGHIDLFRIWKELLMVPLAMAAVWLAYRNKSTKKWLTNSKTVLLILIYALSTLGLGMVALSRGKVSSSALIYALLINLRFFVFFVVAAIITANNKSLSKNWQKLIIWPAVIVITFGLAQHFILPNNWLAHFGYGPKTIPAYSAVDKKPDYIRIQSTLRGPNPLGAYLVVILTIMIYGLFKDKKKLKLWFGFGLTLLMLFFTYSRSAWLGLILSAGLIFWWQASNKVNHRFLLSTLTFLILVVGLSAFGLRHNNFLQNTLFHTDETSHSLESSNAVRTEAISHGLKSVVDQPFGKGPGTAGPASFRNTTSKARISENYFIQIGQEVGILGLALFLAIYYLVAKQLWQQKSDLAKILLASLAGLTLVNLLSHAWADDTLAYIWWGLAGIALAPSVILNKERKKTNG